MDNGRNWKKYDMGYILKNDIAGDDEEDVNDASLPYKVKKKRKNLKHSRYFH